MGKRDELIKRKIEIRKKIEKMLRENGVFEECELYEMKAVKGKLVMKFVRGGGYLEVSSALKKTEDEEQ